MLELIYQIPSHIGWIIVGVLGCLCVQMLGLLVGTCVQAIRERIKDRKAEEGED